MPQRKQTTVTLLIFNKNLNKGIIRNAQLFKDIVDEIVTVDSSTQESYQQLKLASAWPKCRIHHVFPTGYVEPMRIYGVNKVQSEYILYLDSDETPSLRLVNDLPHLNTYEGYWVSKQILLDTGRERLGYSREKQSSQQIFRSTQNCDQFYDLVK